MPGRYRKAMLTRRGAQRKVEDYYSALEGRRKDGRRRRRGREDVVVAV